MAGQLFLFLRSLAFDPYFFDSFTFQANAQRLSIACLLTLRLLLAKELAVLRLFSAWKIVVFRGSRMPFSRGFFLVFVVLCSLNLAVVRRGRLPCNIFYVYLIGVIILLQTLIISFTCCWFPGSSPRVSMRDNRLFQSGQRDELWQIPGLFCVKQPQISDDRWNLQQSGDGPVLGIRQNPIHQADTTE